MASPPAFSPAGSPPYPSSMQLPSSKKRGSITADLAVQPPALKRRKASTMSIASAGSAHPLRQTSFPPDESHIQAFSPSFNRSPSADTMSHISINGSQVSGVPARKKRGRKSKAERASEAAAEAMRDGSPSVVGGRAGTVVSTTTGGRRHRKDDDANAEKDGEDEVPESMTVTSAARTKEQLAEEEELKALLKSQMDVHQFRRYEVWRSATLRPADVKRHINSVTSQSCPSSVHQMMQTVCKMFLGEIVEAARDVQDEWVRAGETQTDYPGDELEPSNELSQYRRTAPLRPEHLREAYRRHKAAPENGGAMGSLLVWNQQTQNGSSRFAAKAGGRRIFK